MRVSNAFENQFRLRFRFRGKWRRIFPAVDAVQQVVGAGAAAVWAFSHNQPLHALQKLTKCFSVVVSSSLSPRTLRKASQTSLLSGSLPPCMRVT